MKLTLRTKDQKAETQSSLSEKYVLSYHCEKWSEKRKAGYEMWKNGEYIASITLAGAKQLKDENKAEDLKTAKEIRKMAERNASLQDKYIVKIADGTIGTIDSDTINFQHASDFIGEIVEIYMYDHNCNIVRREGKLVKVF